MRHSQDIDIKMLKFSKDLAFRKILLGKPVTYNTIVVGVVKDVKIKNDSVTITALINDKCKNLINDELKNPQTIVADLGIELKGVNNAR